MEDARPIEPAAFYVGADPVHYLVAPSRYGEDELAVAGGIRGAPVEMVKCETVDLEVPASAEYVVEGEVAMDEVEPEGPFGEFTGYMAGGRACPVFNVKCITHRKDPIVMGVVSQFPPSKSSMIKKVLLEAGLMRHLTETLNIPGIADVHALEAGGCTAALWVSLRKIYTGQVDQVMFGALGDFGTSYFKWIVVTDDDVDIRDPFMRDWIMSWRVQPDKDVRIFPNSGAVELDPSVHPPNVIPPERLGGKALIDATKKFDFRRSRCRPCNTCSASTTTGRTTGCPSSIRCGFPRGSKRQGRRDDERGRCAGAALQNVRDRGSARLVGNLRAVDVGHCRRPGNPRVHCELAGRPTAAEFIPRSCAAPVRRSAECGRSYGTNAGRPPPHPRRDAFAHDADQ